MKSVPNPDPGQGTGCPTKSAGCGTTLKGQTGFKHLTTPRRFTALNPIVRGGEEINAPFGRGDVPLRTNDTFPLDKGRTCVDKYLNTVYRMWREMGVGKIDGLS